MDKDNLREFARVEVSLRVTYSVGEQRVLAHSTDLSQGGMFIAASQYLPINAVIRVVLTIPDGSAEIPVICRVVYVRATQRAGTADGHTGMGVEFLDLGPQQWKLVEGFIEARRNGVSAKRTPQRQRLDVVVVDDDPSYRDLAAVAFHERGDVVRTGKDGFEGISLCLRAAPDVILSDVQMPRMDGWQFLRIVRSRPSLASVPFVLLTTLTGDDERLRGYQLGVDDYVAKPYRSDELQVRVDRLVKRAQSTTHAHVERKTLRGDLEQVAVPSLLSFLEMEQKTGELMVLNASEGQEARLYLRAGRVVRVELAGGPADARSSDVIYEVLSWHSGQFEFAARDVVIEDDLQVSTTGLLLEHARRSDERGRS